MRKKPKRRSKKVIPLYVMVVPRDGLYFVEAYKPGICIDPLHHVGCVPPVLVADGRKNPKVTIEEAEEFVYRALTIFKKQGWDPTYINPRN